MDDNQSPEIPPPGAPERERRLIDAARQQVRPRDGQGPEPGGPGDARSGETPESVTLESPASSEPAFGGPPPDSFAGYQILREIGRAGQGVVYQAIQKSTHRKVAIKVMKEGPFASAADQARFEREVQILGQLNHPNIVAIHDTGVAAGCQYFVMDYISGQPLDVHMAGAFERHEGTEARRHEGAGRAPGLSVESTLRLFAKICAAVNAAHLRGVIHRDLKPGNIRVDENGEPHILDFGLAKTVMGATTNGSQPEVMTVTGQFIGSLPWASPEQAEGMPSKIDIRTDVYSLGVILYQMLTGKFPYEVVGNMRDVLDRIVKTEPAKPSTIRKQINDEVETIVLKCLSKERERRYQTAGELARDIGHYLSGEPIEAKRDSSLYVLRKQLRRYRAPIAVCAAFVVVLVVGFVTALVLWQQAASQRDRALKAEAEMRHEQAEKERIQAAAIEPFRQGYYSRLKRFGFKSAYLDESLNAFVTALTSQGRLREAEAELRTFLTRQRKGLPPGDRWLLEPLILLTYNLCRQGKYEEAEEVARERVEIERAKRPGPNVATGCLALGRVLAAQKKFADAEGPLLEAHSLFLKEKLLSGDQQESLIEIITLYENWDAAQPGKGYTEKASEWRTKLEELKAATQPMATQPGDKADAPADDRQ